MIARILRRYTDPPRRDYGSLLHVREDYGISELRVTAHDGLAGKTLAESRPGDEGMVVLGIERGDRYLGAPTGRTGVLADDTLLLYGPMGRVKELARRLSGISSGRRARRVLGAGSSPRAPWMSPRRARSPTQSRITSPRTRSHVGTRPPGATSCRPTRPSRV